MRILTAFILIFLLTQCNRNNKKEVIASYQDSISIYLDSMSKINVTIPPLYDRMWTDSSTVVNFFELANQTNGEIKIVADAKNIVLAINEVIEDAVTDQTDILFLVDKTSSMFDDIENVKLGLNQIINEIKKYKKVRVGIALYGDKNSDGSEWYSFKDFNYNYNDLKNYIANISLTGGGDYPESVYDGFFKFCNENFWESQNKRIIILIGDAPPLEKPNSDYSIQEMISKAKGEKIQMNFYPIVVSPQTFTSVNSPPVEYKSTKLISSLYPNPAFNLLKVQFKESASYKLQIYASDGKLLSTEDFNGTLWQKSVTQFVNGTYVLRAINSVSNKFETIQFVVYK